MKLRNRNQSGPEPGRETLATAKLEAAVPASLAAVSSPQARGCLPGHKPAILIGILLFLLVLGTYAPAIRNCFVNYDDADYVTANVQVQNGLTWAGLKWACLHTVSSNWHPVTMWSLMLDCQLFGLKPWGHHLTNVLLHALNGVLVFALLRQMTGATWRSLLVAALFAVHPLRVESVAWVAERKDVLSGCFGLLALLAYAKYAERGERRTEGGDRRSLLHPPSSTFYPLSLFYLLSLFFFALGLMSKAMLVTWPFVMLLLDYWPLGRFTLHASRFTILRRLLLEKLPFFALAAVASVVTFLVQKQTGAMLKGAHIPLGARGENALVSYCRYLEKLFWPRDLAVYYPHPGSWPMLTVALAGALLAAISILVWARRRDHPFLLTGWLWYCGTLAPVLGLVQVGGQSMADRYTYLPSLGVLIAVVWGAYELTRRWRYAVIGWSVAGATAIVLCLALTRQQIGYWQDGEALFRHAIAATSNNSLAHKNLAIALNEKGQTDEEIAQYQEVIRLKPDDADARNNLGLALGQKGQIDAEIGQFQELLRLNPDFEAARLNLGIALDQKGRIDEAVSQFQKAIRLKPDDAAAYYNLGVAFGHKGQIDAEIAQYQEAIRVEPDYADAHNNLGIAFGRKGQIDEAVSQFQEAIRLEPDNADTHNNLGIALGHKGEIDEAIRQFREAIRLNPDYAEACNNLGSALGRKGQIDEAIRQFQEAIRLEPDYADAHYKLSLALGQQGQTNAAIREYQEAMRLNPGRFHATTDGQR